VVFQKALMKEKEEKSARQPLHLQETN